MSVMDSIKWLRPLGLAWLCLSTASAQRTPFQAADLHAWREVAEVRIAPDGKAAVYAESRRDRATGDVQSNLWLVSTDGRSRRALTEGAWRDWSPRWESDPPGAEQRFAYLTNRAGRTEIRIRQGTQDSPVSGVTQAPLTIALSPRGDAVAFTALAAADARQNSPTWAPPDILPFLHAVSAGHAQLFVVAASGGAPRRLTTGDLDWIGEPAWMPDGQTILCAAAAADSAHPLQGASIFSVRVADGAMKQLTQSDGNDEQPTPSPDGSRIAWLSTAGRAQSYNVRHLFVMNHDGSRVKQLTGAFDRDVSRPQWSSDSRTVYFLAEDSGAAHVYAARNDGTVRPVTKGAERLRDFSLADNGRAAAIRSSAHEAGDVISFAADLPGGVITLYSPNEHLLAEREIGAVEEMRYDSAGHAIQSWLVKPPGFDAAEKYPLLLNIKDSPRGMYGEEFQLRAQIFAAAGFVVLLVNPRGSPGYGEQFGNLLPTRNPGDDADDLLRGVDAAVAKGYIDTRRIAFSGGLVAAWILGHSDRFASAVLRDAVADRAAEIALAPDGLGRAASEMGALPWDDPAQYWQHSPIYFAGGFKTPTLIVSRVGDTQGREFYFALQARKVDSALVELPVSGASFEEAELEAEIAWLKK
ncbi:MAG: prolyl oligopeptidase family serine peptidase [Bryobacteraceae bacterium]